MGSSSAADCARAPPTWFRQLKAPLVSSLRYRDRTRCVPHAICEQRVQIATVDAEGLNSCTVTLVSYKEIISVWILGQNARTTFGGEGKRAGGRGKRHKHASSGTNRIHCNVGGSLIRHIEEEPLWIYEQRKRTVIRLGGEWRALNFCQSSRRLNVENRDRI